MKRWISRLCLGSLAGLLVACGSDSRGEGSVVVSVWGEDYIEDGIPADGFEDGWSIEYDKFLIALGDVSIEKDGANGRSLAGIAVFDLTEAGPHGFGSIEGLAEGNWDEFGFSSLVADAYTERSDSAGAADLELMVAEGYNVYVSGRASKAGAEVRFAWGFAEPVRYASCVDLSEGQETAGVVVGDKASVEAQLTIHGDHLFYDDLASREAKLRFDVIAAADADDDGEVSLDELAAVRLADLGPDQGTYGVGASDVDDMRAFVEAATTSLGHFNGEGHCRPERP